MEGGIRGGAYEVVEEALEFGGVERVVDGILQGEELEEESHGKVWVFNY